jgi:hypothetical protein
VRRLGRSPVFRSTSGQTVRQPNAWKKAYGAWSLTVAFVVFTSLIVFGSIGTSASAAARPSVRSIQSGWSYVPEYSSAPALAEGRVVNSSGAPVSQATVILFPVPLEPKPGVALTPIARTITDAQGNFTVSLPAAQDARLTTARSEGALDFQVIAFYPGGIAHWFYSFHPGAHESASRTPATLVLHASLTGASEDREAAISPDTCEPEGTPTHISNIPVILGLKESDASDVSVVFSYGATSSVTLGAGISYTSPNGGFSTDGSTTQSTGGYATWPPLSGVGNNYFEGAGEYTEQETLCDVKGDYSQYWTITQKDVTGMYGTPGAPAIATGDCSPEDGGSTLTFTNGTQETFGAGVQLSNLGYGINLSSQIGWSSTVTIEFHFGAVGHPLCGIDAKPGTAGYVGVIGVHSSTTV